MFYCTTINSIEEVVVEERAQKKNHKIFIYFSETKK